MSTWRELCRELIDSRGPDYYRALERARAALAQPEPKVVGPTVQLSEGPVQRGNGKGGPTTPKPVILPKGQASARAALELTPAAPLKERPDFIAGYREGLADGRRIVEHEDTARAALDNSDGPAVSDGKGSVPTRPVTDDDLDLLVIAIQALTPHQPDASTHNLAAVDRGREILRNAFTRWGRPAPAPAGEVAELVAWLGVVSEQFRLAELDPEADQTDRAADLLERQAAPVPVAISERLPGPEDCESHGWCWVLYRGYSTWALEPPCGQDGMPTGWTHWLPAHALPLPSGEVEA